MKISPGTDRLKVENQKGKDVMRRRGARERGAVQGEEPVLFSF